MKKERRRRRSQPFISRFSVSVLASRNSKSSRSKVHRGTSSCGRRREIYMKQEEEEGRGIIRRKFPRTIF
jgi:hypothetical protein